MAPNFKVYTAENLRKINAQRRAVSQPDIYLVPHLDKEQVLFVSAADMHNEPASCYNCHLYNAGSSCQLIGPHVLVRKFTYPPAPTADAKVIEYWPCCGMHDYGEPNDGLARFTAANDPSTLGLIWINAPRPGQAHGGANCGGENGGDDCDHYCTETGDKRDEPQGFCRVLQTVVMNGDVCAAWDDDDKVTWTKAQTLLQSLGDSPSNADRKDAAEGAN